MSKKIVGKGATNEAPGQQHHDQHHVVSSEGAQVVNPGPGGTVTLPEGTTIVSLEADGRDLIIVLSDGEKILVPDGAVVVPEIVVDNTAVPPANIAALLIDNEVQPAAGPTQSSGGNFAADEGAIQSAYGLGNLLPYTELHFELQPRHELFPADVNKEPSVVVETPDNPAGAVDAVATVHEAGLPARDGEPAGTGEAADGNLTNNSDPSETTNGTIVVNSPDGIQAVLINGTAIDHVGQTFTSPDGTLKITSIDLAAGRIGFSYTLADNLLGQTTDGPFQVTVIDSDGDQATATLHINVVDDAPIAAADTDTVAAGTYGPESGNVITGDGTTSGAAGADRVGADDASVSAVSHGEQNVTADESGTMVIAGDYGTLTIHDDGSYTYVRNAGTSGGVDDRFTYTLTDGDGSTDTATLTIHIDDSPAVVTSVPETGDGTIVDETGLPPHDGGPVGVGEDSDGIPDNNSDTSETTHGTITFTAPDGPASVEINNTVITGANQVITIPEGTLTITAFDPAAGTLDYSFTLTNNTSGDNTSVTFTVTVTDVDGDSDSAPFTIHIVDDTPLATPDADSVTEDGPLTADGNVLTGSGGSDANTTDGVADSQGADGAHVTAVAFGATAGTVGTGLAGAYGTLTLNSDGSYSYALDNTNALVQGLDKNEHLTETFTYTITDGDGDPSTTTLTITINGADDGVTIGGLNADGAEQTVYEANLADGSAPDAAALTQTGTFTVTAQDGLATISVGGHTVYTGDAFVPGQTVSTAYGTLTITGVTPTTTDANGDVTAATVSYSYELTDNTLAHTGANDVSLTDSFDITVTDTDGSTANDHLEVTVVDDTPLATPDADSVTEDGPLTADGNVLTGSGGSDANTTDGVADSQGADGAHVTAVAFGATAGTVGTGLAGAYGTLTLNSDGSYSYALDNTNALVQGLDKNEHLTETFTYTITDGDGDPSTTTLTITINGADDGVTIGGLNADGAEQTVYEANLADGSAPDAAALTQTGTFTVTAQDGLATISVGGHTVYTGDAFVPGQTVSTAYGTLTITGVTPTTTDANGDVTAATVSYSYELTDNTLAHTGANDVSLTDSFDITVTDTDGSTANDHLEVTVVDDTPLATPDADSVTEDGPLTADGNVLTGSGGSDANTTDGVADSQGADGAHVTAVAFGATAGTVGTGLAGAYGTLTLNSDGSYSYALDNTNALVQGLDKNEHLTETFTYTITDGDGDPSTTTLTITINGADDGVTIGGLNADGAEQTVYEANLADGSAPDAAALTQTGTFTVTAQDGLATISVGGHTVYTGDAFVPGQTVSTAYGTLTITGVTPTTTDANGDVTAATVSYSYELTDNTLAHTGANDVSLTDSFDITVTDTDGSTANDHLEVTVVDDTPLATPDADSVTEDGPLTADGNVLTGSGGSDANTTDGVADSQGADGAHVTAVAFGATAGTVGTGLAGAYGTLTLNSDGSYSYALDNTNALVQGLDKNEHLTETFTYTITDGDGDPSTTTLTITINGADDGVTIGGLNADGAEQTVYEANLADGSAPDAAALTQTGTFTVTAQDGLATISVGGHTVYTGDAFVPGQTVSTAYGTLTITGVTPTTTDANGDVTAATVSYSYELTDNTLAHTGANDVSLTDSFDITVTDTDGSTANDHLEVTVVDDTPLAFDNSNTVDEGGSVGGNVLSDGTPDVFGADGKGGVVTFTDGVHTAAPGGTIETALGFLTINADGSYDYESKPNSTSVDTHDTFTYTIVDADGDTSPATLTIDITATAGNVSDNDVSVDESGLDNGTYTGSQLVPDGEFDTNGQISATGGTPPYSYVLTSPADGTYGTLALNGSTGAYSYTLDTPFTDAVNENSRNVVNGAESFTYDVYDNLGNFIGSGSISVNITDDVPTAVDDALQTLAEDAAGTIGGNVMANDTQGADGASVTSVNIGGVDHAIAAVGTTTVDTANGHYTFQADGTWTFDPNTGLDQSGGPIDASFTYTLTDGDGDHDTATQPISITDGAGPTGGDTLSLTVDDGALADGNNSASGAEVDAGQLTFTAGSDALTTFAFGTDLSALGGGLTWTRVDATTITGKDGANLVVTLKLTAPASIGAGASGDVTVTATLADNYAHHPGLGDDLQALGNVTVVASDQDGDSATGTVSLSVSDDVPTIAVIGDTSVVEGQTATGTWSESVGADSPGTTVAVFNGTEYALGTAINTGKGTLTVNANGTWSFTANSNLDNSVAQGITFSVKVTDADHDVATDPQTITITDGAGPTGGDTLSLTVDDGALADGNNSASGAEVDAGQLTFTAGSDALTTFAFGTDLSALGGGLTWTRVDATTITGKDGANLVVTLKLTAPASIGAGASGDVTVTATLADNYAHHPGLGDDLQALGNVTVVASDQDGDSATGTVSLSVSDDVPTIAVIGDTSVVEGQTATGTWSESVGADSPGTTVAVFNGTEYALGTAINTGKGTLTVNANGTWSFTANSNLDNSVAQGITFSVKVTDADHDVATDPQTITITDGAGPTGGDTLSLTVDDGALADGNNSASGAEVDAGQLTFTAGSDALTTFAFGTDLSALGGGLTWTRVDATTITGKDGANLVVTLKLTAPASIGAGASGDVTVTATLADNYAHHPGLGDDLQALGNVTVVASDQDGDSATGTVSLSVSDDVPTIAVIGDTSVVEGQTATGTWSESVGADSPGTTVAVFNGTEYALGTAINTGKGTLTVNANGTWSFTANSNLDNSVAQGITFSVKVTDADHDVATDPQTITITDGAGPTGGDTLSLTVDDGALADGNDSASGAEVDAGQLTFTAGSDALTTFAFGTDLSALGGGLTWTRVDATTITGKDGANLVVTLKLTAPASIGAGASGDVTVTATLADNYAHHPGLGDDLQALGNVTVVASDQDGDSATGTVSLSVSDDVPTIAVIGDTSVVEGQTATGTWSESVGADSPGTTVAVFNGTEYALGTAINTGKGTLTVNANGTWSFTANSNLDNSVAQGITFSVKVTDADHDVATDPQTITITDGAGPTGGDTLSLTVDDGALADGNNSASGAEVDAGQLTFTAGSDALTTFAFGTDLSALGGGLTWTRVDATTITGKDGANLVVTLKLTAPASIGAGASGDVTVTATLADNYAHHPGLGDDLQALGNVTVVASDQDGDSATGTVSLSVSDDVPVAVVADAVSVTNVATGNNYAYLDADHDVSNNYGADGPGAVIFTAATISTLQAEGLTSGLASLNYAITNGGTTLVATKSTDSSVVFTIDLQPSGHDSQYHVTMSQPLDSLQTVDFNDGGYNFVGGNGSWAGFTQPGDNDSQDLLLTPVGGGTVNTNANEGGIAGGNSVGSGEAMRVDYVVDLSGSPVSGGNFYGGDNTQSFDKHYTINGGSAFFTQITSSTAVHIAAFDDDDSGTLKNVGDGDPDTITSIAISYNSAKTVISANGTYSVGGHNFTVAFNADGTVNVSGVVENTRIGAYTSDGYNSIEWGYASGNTFKIGDFGATVVTNSPVHFTVPISIQDGDGDTVSSGNLSITANPVTPPVALDLNGDGLQFLGLDAGVTHDYGHGAVATAWTTPGDGILAHDTGHGLDIVFTDDAAGARTDLQGLELAYDSNHDGQLTSADAAWSSFGVWQDANSNGVVDAGEFKTLSQAGITAIGLSTDGQAYSTAGGDVTVLGTGSFTRADGTTAALGDTVFATAAKQISQQTSELSVAAAALGGFMAVPLVHAAMAPTAPEQVTTLAHALQPDAPLGSVLGEHVSQPIGTANLQLTAETAPAAPHGAASSGGSHQAPDSDNAHLPDASHATVTTEQLPGQATLAVESAPAPGAHGPSDVGLMEALLTMHQGGNGAHAAATAAADDGHGAVTTENMPKIAAVLNDALAGHAVDQIVDKFAGWHPNSTQAAGQPPVAANAEHAPAVLDLHLDTHTDTHAALFATMMAMPTVEEHVVAAA